MNKSFFKYYNDELFFLKEMGEEFAKDYPNVAENLSLGKFNCEDPYIERLLEGFAFMAARVHQKLDLEFPRFTQNLISSIYPDYMEPIPSMSIVKFMPDFNEASLSSGVLIPKGTNLTTRYRNSKGTACDFVTGQDVTLWPIKITDIEYYLGRPEYCDIKDNIKSYLCIELDCIGNTKFNQLNIEALDFCITGASNKVSMDLYEMILANTVDVTIQYEDSIENVFQINLNELSEQVVPLGFGEKESLLPYELRSFQVYRLLREYFSYPKKFLFFRLNKINSAISEVSAGRMKIVFSFNKKNYLLEKSITSKNFSLFATPIINVFKKRLDRVSIKERESEAHIVPDNFKPNDFEIIKFLSIDCFDGLNKRLAKLKPFYSKSGFDKYENNIVKYYSLKRKLKDNDKLYPHKGSGIETYLSLIDVHFKNSSEIDYELGITALCSNKYIPTEIPFGTKAKSDFVLKEQYPVLGVKHIEKVSRPIYSHLSSENDWAIVNHLKVNHSMLLSDTGSDKVIRDLLKLYADFDIPFNKKQIQGVQSVNVERATRMLESTHGMSLIRGFIVKLTFDENEFNDSGFLILSRILHLFFKKSVAVNSFVETIVISSTRGEIKKWIK